MGNTNKLYLRGLNSLRFFAALLVVIYHCNVGLSSIDISLQRSFPIMTKGPVAVDFFFILSGYLLTYLACYEYNRYGKLNIIDFFKRRMLRIFPLYYLALFVGFFLIEFIYPLVQMATQPNVTIQNDLIYYILFLPNLPSVIYDSVGPLESLWSIGVEEQFYLVFPFAMIILLKQKKFILFLCLFLFVYCSFFFGVFYNYIELSPLVKKFITHTLRFHFLIYGCIIGAYIYNHPTHWFLILLQKKEVQLLSWLLFIGSLFILTSHQDNHNLISGILFSIIMVIVSLPKTIVNIERKPLIYLGSISFGIYVYHPYVSIFLRYFINTNSNLYSIVISSPILFYFGVTLVTILVAHLSYRYYERYFLFYKKKFEK